MRRPDYWIKQYSSHTFFFLIAFFWELVSTILLSMKRILLIFAVLLGSCLSIYAQDLQEVVYLKNGSVIKGVIIEQTPNESLKIQTSDGSIFAYKMIDVLKITKEAQTNTNTHQRATINQNRKDFGLKSGYKGYLDFGYAIAVGDYGMGRIEFTTTQGYQINPYIYVGAGTGIHYFTDGYLAVPFFANARANFIKGNISPFFDVKLGYSFVDIGGVYFSPSVGCRFGLGKKIGLNVSLGYSLQMGDFYYYGDYYDTVNLGGFNFKLGFDF